MYNQTTVYIGTANNRMQIPIGQHVRPASHRLTLCKTFIRVHIELDRPNRSDENNKNIEHNINNNNTDLYDTVYELSYCNSRNLDKELNAYASIHFN